MATFTLQYYLTRPLTDQEKKWLRDDLKYQQQIRFHQQKVEEYKNSLDVGDQLRLVHHTQEVERYQTKANVLVKPDLNKPAFMLEPEKANLIRMNKCPMCKEDIDFNFFGKAFSKSFKEYAISGTCVQCQSKMFK